MTREEAIEILEYKKAEFEEDYYVITAEALDMAIKALLEQKPIQEKQAESEKYQKAFDDGYMNGYAQARFDYEVKEITQEIKQEPITERIERGTDGSFYKLTISNGKEFEQEPKPGHWIKYDNEYFADGRLSPVTRNIIECSACHTKIADFYGKMYYCPYCGEPKESEGI